jgi:exopolyphosphatase/guanosine-5'-triphosphate,3'-diphosphate pyrophosphatase
MALPSHLRTAAGATARRAVIDVGTNSVKLLVADVTGPALEVVCEQSEQTRLGRGFYPSLQLAPVAIRHTAETVAAFRARATRLGATTVRVIATSAARDARNAGDLLAAIQATAGLPAEIITGDQEADWTFQGVTSDPRLAGRPLLVIEVGGGSTQFILGHRGNVSVRESFPLGTVRLLEACPLSDPPAPAERAAGRAAADEALARSVAPVLQPPLAALPAPPALLVGTGGTASILGLMELGTAEFDRARLDGLELSRAAVERHGDRLWSLPLAQRRQVPGLPADRADVILLGVTIYAAVLERFGFPALRVSLRGVRAGALLAET